jgi:hypothetical protein
MPKRALAIDPLSNRQSVPVFQGGCEPSAPLQAAVEQNKVNTFAAGGEAHLL